MKQLAHDQIIRRISEHFSRHALAHLVAAILRADGFQTKIAGPGPDGGIDIWASRGPQGFDPPYICVQVKSSKHPEKVETLRALQGAMTSHHATQGLLVAWGGFTPPLVREAQKNHFNIRLWSSAEVVEEIFRTYDRLSEEIRSELPLERIWIVKT